MVSWEKEVFGIALSQLIMKAAIVIVLIVIGIALGKLVKFLLRKALEKAKVEKVVKYGFVELLLAVVKWSIYIIFINLALIQLDIPEFTNWLTSVLVVIPALVGASILIAVGFAIAIYLKGVIEDSRIEGWKILSKIFFFFVLYIFMIFAFKTALISLDKNTVNLLLIILSTITAAGVSYWYAKQK